MLEELVTTLTLHHLHTFLFPTSTLAGVKPAPRCKLVQHRVHSPAPYTWLLLTCFASSSWALCSHCPIPHRGTQKNWLNLPSHAGCRIGGLLVSNSTHHEPNSHLALQWHLLKPNTISQSFVAFCCCPKTRRASSLNNTKINRKGNVSGVCYD